MQNWSEVLKELQNCKRTDALDFVRRKYLAKLYKITGRNVIAYYSGFLQRPNINEASINDNDKNGFMNAINKLDRTKGLDLILHTPGGGIAAAESLVDYIKRMFGNDVRAIIPQIAMSAGTMIACSCSSIVMGKQSNLGPIDPQFRGIPASAVVEEFQRAYDEIKADKNKIAVWQPILAKYHPTFIGECEKSILWAREIVTSWLTENMFSNSENPGEKAKIVVDFFSSHGDTKSHGRHINIDSCEAVGLDIIRMEEPELGDQFQDTVLTIHHAYMHTFSNSDSVKIIENHKGAAIVQHLPRNLDRGR